MIWPKLSPDGTKMVWSSELESKAQSKSTNGRWAINLADIDLEAGTISNHREWQDPDGLPAFYECYGWMPEPRTWRDIEPADATDISLPHEGIEGPLIDGGERCSWPWDPQQLVGAPLGQYHCPYCGEMVIAGIPHTDWTEEPGTLIFASTTRATSTGFRAQQLFTLPDSLPAVAPTRISPAIEQTVSEEEVEVGVKALVDVYGSGRSELDDPAVRAALLATRPPLDCFHEFAHFAPNDPNTLYTCIGTGGDGGDDLWKYDLTGWDGGLLPQPTQVSWFNGRWEGFKVVQVPGWPAPERTYLSSMAWVDGAWLVTTSPELLSGTVNCWSVPA